jgi:hypothetical protein
VYSLQRPCYKEPVEEKVVYRLPSSTTRGVLKETGSDSFGNEESTESDDQVTDEWQDDPVHTKTDSLVVSCIIIANLYDDMVFRFIQTSKSLPSIQTHQSLVYFYSLFQSDTLPLWLLYWFHVSYLYPSNLVILVSPF